MEKNSVEYRKLTLFSGFLMKTEIECDRIILIQPCKLYPEYWIRLMFCILYIFWIQYSPDILFSICTEDIPFIPSVSRILLVSYLYKGYYLYSICIVDITCILSVSRILPVSYLYPECYLYPIYIQDIACILSKRI